MVRLWRLLLACLCVAGLAGVLAAEAAAETRRSYTIVKPQHRRPARSGVVIPDFTQPRARTPVRIGREPPKERPETTDRGVPFSDDCKWEPGFPTDKTEYESCKTIEARPYYVRTGRQRARSAADIQADIDAQARIKRGCEADYVSGKVPYLPFNTDAGYLEHPEELVGKSFELRQLAYPESPGKLGDIVGVTVLADRMVLTTTSGKRTLPVTSRGGVSCYGDASRCYLLARNLGEKEVYYLLTEPVQATDICDVKFYIGLKETVAGRIDQTLADTQAENARKKAARQAALKAGKPVPELGDGYENAWLMKDFYNGNLAGYDRNDWQLPLLVGIYISEYDLTCRAALGTNYKVYTHMRKQYTGSETRMSLRGTIRIDYYETVAGRQVYVRPELYNSYAAAMIAPYTRIAAAYGEALQSSGSEQLNGPGEMMYIVNKFGQTMQRDVQKFLAEEGCASPTARKFESAFSQAVT